MYFLLFLACALQFSALAAQSSGIPGTNLVTNQPYRLRLKNFPNGTLSWTYPVHEGTGARYVQADNPNSSIYDKNGQWYVHGLWTIKPFSGSSCSNNSWYEIVNRGIPGEYLTISEAGETNGYGKDKSYLLLQPNYYPDFSSQAQNDKFLWKPQMYVSGGSTYYWLVNKAFPQGVATWTTKKYANDGYYTMLDNTGDSRYNSGGEWFNDKLFIFESQ